MSHVTSGLTNTMSIRMGLAALTIAMGAHIPALSAVKPSNVEIFGNWAVACDNIRHCEMTTLWDNSRENDQLIFNSYTEISLKREAGPTGKTVLWIGFNGSLAEELPNKNVVYSLQVDGKTVAKGQYGHSGVTYKEAQALELAQILVNGQRLNVVDPKGVVVARNSLKGSSASMRYMDAKQHRVGTVSAFVAKGEKPASSVPAAPDMPTVSSPGSFGQAVKPTKAEMAKMHKLSECPPDPEIKNPFNSYALNGGATLVLLSCGSGAYNTNEVPFIIRTKGKQRELTIAAFDFDGGWGSENGIPSLVNGYWDSKSRTLGSAAKGRGIGDCGSSETWVWDGTMFRLTESRNMSDCRGSHNWLRTWKAKIVR